jgi:hypothetical protein
VVPTEQATGTLWITTDIANTVIAPISLKTPMASPSMKLCKVIATPKAIRDYELTFWYFSSSLSILVSKSPMDLFGVYVLV